MSIATKKVEGMKRSIPHSHEKEKIRSMVLCCKMRLRECKGKVVDGDLMRKRKERAEMQHVAIQTREEAQEWVEKAKILWAEVVENGKEMREKELLDYHHEEIIGDDVKLIKKKKRILAGIKRTMKRNHAFHCLSRHAGKGFRENMKRLKVMNENNEVEETLAKRDEIEERIEQCNSHHFKNAHDSTACKDKTCEGLINDVIRDKILNGTLRRDECDDENVYQLLKLLHQNGRNDYRRHPREINKQDWMRVVKQSKRSSASSIFSKRTHAVCKCALKSE